MIALLRNSSRKICRNSFLMRYKIVLIMFILCFILTPTPPRFSWALSPRRFGRGLRFAPTFVPDASVGVFASLRLLSPTLRSGSSLRFDFCLLSSYWSLTLKFLTLNPINITVMTISMRVSFHTYKKPVPLIMMFFIINMKYLGGRIALTQS